MSYRAHRKILWIALLAGIAILAVFVGITAGTSLARLSFEELAQRSTAIARLRCLTVETRWDNNEIWTSTTFAVLEQNKGTLGATVTIQMLGGNIGNLHSRVDGVPAFRPGEEIYAFLWSRGAEPFRLLGWSQGTFRISHDSRTGFELVTQDSADTPIYQPDAHEFSRRGIRNLPVDDFRRKLTRALAQKAP